MKWLIMPLLGVIFVALIACSIQSISADHLEPGQGIFKDRSEVDLVTTHNSDYQVYLQAVLRNGDGQLINVTETTATGAYIPHEITDYVFDMLMGKKEIIIIDNIKYEKVRYAVTHDVQTFDFSKSFQDMQSFWSIEYCTDFTTIGHGYNDCIHIFQTTTPHVSLGEDDIFTIHWTILREF